MEHILQFGVSIDDEYIQRQVITNAEKKLTEEMIKDIRDVMFRCDAWGHPYEPSDWVKEEIKEFMNDNKNEIIDMAADKLADKLSRSKAVKDALAGKISRE